MRSETRAPERAWAAAALVAYGFADAAGMVAAAVSGFVGPVLARGVVHGAPESRAAFGVAFHYNGALFAGWLRLDVHGVGLVTLAQSVRFIVAGILLARTKLG